jgi:2-oxoglutarate ferredoxin oxidoreductase subunit gamma
MTEIRQVCLSGFGGQGILLAGALLGEAGVIEGKSVSGSNSYGAQARGSGCKSEIVFSDGPIDYPHLTTADYLVAMSQGTYDLYAQGVRRGGGFILYDDGLVKPRKDLDVKQVGLPATDQAVKKLNNKQAANIVLLGAFVEMTKIVTPEAIQKAMKVHVSERFRELNLKAFEMGMTLGRQAHG